VRLTGYKKDEVMGRDLVQDFITDEYKELVKAVLDDALKGDETSNYEFPLYSKDGNRLEIMLNATSRRDMDGNIIGVIGIGQDMTEMKSAQAKQERTAIELTQLIDTANAPIFGIDIQGKVSEWNQTAVRITGYRKEEVMGRDLVQDFITDDFKASVGAVLEKALKGVETANFEFPLFNRSGNRIDVLLNSTTRRDISGETIGVIGVGQNITELKDKEEQLQIALGKAERATEVKSQFLASMSHEIRTPMNAVLGVLALLKDSSLDEIQSDFVRTGEDSGKLLLTIINDILDFTSMESHQLQLEDAYFDLPRILTSCINITKHLAEKKHLHLTLVLQPGLPRYVSGDASRLQQIIINLINNAIKFTASGEIILTAAAQVRNNKVILSCAVKDSGAGIAEASQGTLFDEFTMVDQSHSRRHEGTGLGLVICKRLVSLMEGHIGVDSTLGKGSTFSFKVKLGKAEDKDGSDRLTIDGQESPPTLLDDDTRILLAEDNVINQKVIKNLLNAKGLFVDVVSNGEEALAAVASQSYDIVLMDVSMPGMDGMTSTKKIRQLSGAISKIPIVALTAHTLSGDRERIMASGMDDYLEKPIDILAMLNCIARWTEPVTLSPELNHQ
jgi:PAS domain S-box-containing protein